MAGVRTWEPSKRLQPGLLERFKDQAAIGLPHSSAFPVRFVIPFKKLKCIAEHWLAMPEVGGWPLLAEPPLDERAMEVRVWFA